MSPEQVIALVRQQNDGRSSLIVARKEILICKNPFTFLRGTALLFWKRVQEIAVSASPAVWACGDLHLQNVGTFKGSDRLTYFDINDFDEACLLPASWEIVRMLVSLRLCQADTRTFLARLLQTLASGNTSSISRETATGPVREIVDSLKDRSRKDFLDKRSTKKSGIRTLIVDGDHALAASSEQRLKVTQMIQDSQLARDRPDYYRVIDVAFRIAGNGSMGIERYLVLVEGKGAPDNNHLLDVKASLRSNAACFSPLVQPVWSGENSRIVTLQQRIQAVPPAHLEAIGLPTMPFVVKALQPSEDKIDWGSVKNDPIARNNLLHDVADVCAWAQLRSAGLQGSASIVELADWASEPETANELERFTDQLERQVRSDWKVFSDAFSPGRVETQPQFQ